MRMGASVLWTLVPPELGFSCAASWMLIALGVVARSALAGQRRACPARVGSVLLFAAERLWEIARCDECCTRSNCQEGR